MGGMNLCFVFGSGHKVRLLTPALTGTLLAGVTRDALLKLAADHGFQAEEGKISTEEWRAGRAHGSLPEGVARGTAPGVTPLGAVESAKGSSAMGTGETGTGSLGLRPAVR